MVFIIDFYFYLIFDGEKDGFNRIFVKTTVIISLPATGILIGLGCIFETHIFMVS